MKNLNTKLFIKFFFGIIFAIIAVYFFSNQNTLPPSKSNPPLLDEGGIMGGNSESIKVLAGDKTIYLQPNTLFYDALMQAKNAGKITLSGKNYPGLGFFVTDIGPLHSGNGKNLIYYINGKEATVGVSSYTLKNGDIIEWKLK